MRLKFWKKRECDGLDHDAFLRAAELEARVEKASREYEKIKPVASRNMERVLAEHYANNWGHMMRQTLEIRP